MSEEDASEEKPGLFKCIFHHPNFNVVASILTIVGFFLAFFFWYDGIKRPELTYYISSTRTAIIQKGSVTNDLSVNYHGLPVSGDLSSAEIQIWNKGKAAIHAGDILKPIVLKTKNGEPLYSAISTVSRDVIGYSTSQTGTNMMSGNLPMDFKILEQNDGIKVQIIYGGNVNLTLVLDGVIEGQTRGIKENKVTETASPNMVWTMKGSLIVLSCLFVFRILTTNQRPSRSLYTLIMVTCAILIIMLTQIFIKNLYPPPFGF